MTIKINKFQKAALRAGSLPAFSDPGGYPIIYFNDYDNVLCNECAKKSAKEIISHMIYLEGSALSCTDCMKEIESAYGENENN